MYKLHFERIINAAHKITDYEGPCSQIHGHDFKIIIEGKFLNTQANNITIDFRHLKQVVDELDHCYLNEKLKVKNVTAEFLSEYLYHKLEKSMPQLNVTVYESNNNYIQYYEE